MTGTSPPSPDQLERLPFFPLPGLVFFPHSLLPLHIFEPRYRTMTAWCLERKSPLAVVRIRPGHDLEQGGNPPVMPICGAGKIIHHELLSDGRYTIFLLGTARVRIVEELPLEHPFRMARAEILEDDLPAVPDLFVPQMKELKRCLANLLLRWPVANKLLDPILEKTDDPAVLTNQLAAILFQDPDARQEVLECLNVEERLARVKDQITRVITRIASEEGPVQ